MMHFRVDRHVILALTALSCSGLVTAQGFYGSGRSIGGYSGGSGGYGGGGSGYGGGSMGSGGYGSGKSPSKDDKPGLDWSEDWLMGYPIMGGLYPAVGYPFLPAALGFGWPFIFGGYGGTHGFNGAQGY